MRALWPPLYTARSCSELVQAASEPALGRGPSQWSSGVGEMCRVRGSNGGRSEGEGNVGGASCLCGGASAGLSWKRRWWAPGGQGKWSTIGQPSRNRPLLNQRPNPISSDSSVFPIRILGRSHLGRMPGPRESLHVRFTCTALVQHLQ